MNKLIFLLFVICNYSVFAQQELPVKSKIEYEVAISHENGSFFEYTLSKGHAIVVVALPDSRNRMKIEFERDLITITAYVIKYAIPRYLWKEGAVKETPKLFRYSSVKIGMNMHEVAELVGTPTSSDSANMSDDVIVTKYYKRESKTYIITFYNGKVVYSKAI